MAAGGADLQKAKKVNELIRTANQAPTTSPGDSLTETVPLGNCRVALESRAMISAETAVHGACSRGSFFERAVDFALLPRMRSVVR